MKGLNHELTPSSQWLLYIPPALEYKISTFCPHNASVCSHIWFLWGTNWISLAFCSGDVMWFLWGTNWIYICYVEESRPPLWSSGQNSWLEIQRSGFYSWRYQMFWEVVALEQGPLRLVSIIVELLGRIGSSCGLENRDYGRRDPSRWSRGTLYPQKLALASRTRGGLSVGIVRSRTQATEFFSPLKAAYRSATMA
jgi:hypothetical protein